MLHLILIHVICIQGALSKAIVQAGGSSIVEECKQLGQYPIFKLFCVIDNHLKSSYFHKYLSKKGIDVSMINSELPTNTD